MKYKLGEISTFSQGKQVEVNEQSLKKDSEHPIRFIRIVDYTNSEEPVRYIRDFGKRYFATENDVIMIRYGSQTAGKVVMGMNGIIANNMFKMTFDNNIIENKYAYYYLSQKKIYNYLRLSQSSSTMPAISFNILKDFEIDIPTIEVQKKIIKILNIIEDKIKYNTHINNNLYEIMKRFFDNWVNNLDNYEESSLSKIANYINGLAMQKYRAKNEIGLPVIKIKEMNEGITDNTERCSSNIKEDYIIENGDILFAWSGTLCMTIWAQGKAGLNQHIFKVQSKKYPKWFYYLWTEYYLGKFVEIAAGKATTMGHIKRKELDTAKVKIPIKKEMDKMDRIMQPMLDKYINNKINNETLKQVRDTLLPKLMNGEIDLDKIEI